jgi:hypothetical protein
MPNSAVNSQAENALMQSEGAHVRIHVNPISHKSHVVHFAQTMMIQVSTMIA